MTLFLGEDNVACRVRRNWPAACASGFAFLALCLLCPRASADVGVVLNESLDTSVARITGSGHSAVFLSRVCPETPVKLRLCRPGEEGSVISNYTTLGEDQPFEWNVAPLSIYLYGVEDGRQRPLFASEKVKHALEERYREKYLAGYCDTEFCRTSNKAEWREMVAATISRSIYIFVIKTTVQQDEQLIAELNREANRNHFNGVTRNCATFTRRIVNTYFPGATSPEYINDFGMTSPKAIARSFTHYALKHPGSGFYVLHFAQVPGTYKRSSECREGTEQLYHSKKLLVPMAIFAPHELAVVAASYALTGRFNPEKESEEFPTADAGQLNYEIKAAKAEHETNAVRNLTAEEDEQRARVAGTAFEWEVYRAAFGDVVEEAVREEVIPSREYLGRFFKRLDEEGQPVLDEDGSLWIEFPSSGHPSSRVGLSASNLLSASSDSGLADQFILARVDHILKAPGHSRETMRDFRADWARLDRARADRQIRVARGATQSAGSSGNSAPAEPSGVRRPGACH
ncbi:MAG TPA: hypothetical protein VEJ67_16615 [Candidatus Cybelea sp.]|nr:hypothetical protein [Candidatus Cybelea sp.]